jgi:hypothetical protein
MMKYKKNEEEKKRKGRGGGRKDICSIFPPGIFPPTIPKLFLFRSLSKSKKRYKQNKM